MGDANQPDPPDFDALLERIKATDPGQLTTTAKAMTTAADAFNTIRGKMSGVSADIVNFWKGNAFESFFDYLNTLDGDLGSAEWALRDMAGQLTSHAGVTTSAQETVRAESARLTTVGQYSTPSEYETVQHDAYLKVKAATDTFHNSEKTVRGKLWSIGASAPGGIPLPGLPAVPAQSWWKDLLFGSNQPGPQYWIPGKDGPMGYDEDGNLVPAFMAWPMSQQIMEDGIPIGPIIKWLARGGKVAEGAEDFKDLVRASSKWSSGDINKHVREFYRLPGNANDPVPAWAKDEFLTLISKSGGSGKMFQWSLRGQQGAQNTYSTLVRDPETKQWLVAQFYADGEKAGEFATAFKPTDAQLDAMLRQNAVK